MPVKKILIVDDSPTDRFALMEYLVKQGYTGNIWSTPATRNLHEHGHADRFAHSCLHTGA